MSGNIESFIKEMQPVYTGLHEVSEGHLVSQAKLTELEGRIQAIANNKAYHPLIGEAGAKILSVLAGNIQTGQVSNLAKRVDHLGKVLSESLLAKNDPRTALAIAMKIGDADQRDLLVNRAMQKLPLQTTADFDASIEITKSIQNPVFKNYVIQHQILTPLFKRYEETGEVAFLNRIWETACLIPHNSAQPGLEWRSAALARLVGYISEKPDLKVDYDQGKLSIDAISKPARKYSFVIPLLNAFEEINAGAKERTAALQLMNITNEVKLFMLKQFAQKFRDKGDVEGAKYFDHIFARENMAIGRAHLENHQFILAAGLCSDLPEKERAEFAEEVILKANTSIQACLKNGKIDDAKNVLGQIDLGFFTIPDAHKQTVAQWQDAIAKAKGEVTE